MTDTPSISESESLVMEALWTHAPQTADDLVATLGPRHGWQETTIKTFLNRLLKKGVIRAEYAGRRYLYAPILQRADWVDVESRSVLDRLFGGRVAPLVAHFSERQTLTQDDIAALRKLIEDLDQ